MDRQWVDTLQRNRHRLTTELDPDHGLFARLLGYGALSQEQIDACKAEPTRSRRVEKLLDILPLCPYSSYETFLRILSNDLGRSDLVRTYLAPVKQVNKRSERPELSPDAAFKRIRTDTGLASAQQGKISDDSGIRSWLPQATLGSDDQDHLVILGSHDGELPHQSLTLANSVHLRPDQEEVFNSLVFQKKKKVLLIQASGWGKGFVCLEIAKYVREKVDKITLVITPLIALASNQLMSANNAHLKAEVVDSFTRSADDWEITQATIMSGNADVIIATPEQLSCAMFNKNILLNKIGFVVIDEAHCIPEIGHDFRPAYLHVKNIVAKLSPSTPVLATTSTASDTVEADIKKELGISEPTVRGSLMRNNLRIILVDLDCSGYGGMAWIADRLTTGELAGKKGIIYCLTKLKTDLLAGWLHHNRITTAAYHDDVVRPEYLKTVVSSANGVEYRQELVKKFAAGDIRVLVATTALGMGFHDPDVDFVIVYEAPILPSTIYQQIGRAGRRRNSEDGIGIIIFDPDNCKLQENYFIEKPSLHESDIEQVTKFIKRTQENKSSTSQIQKACNLSRDRIERTMFYLLVNNYVTVTRKDKESEYSKLNKPFTQNYKKIREDLEKKKRLAWNEVKSICNGRNLEEKQCLMRGLCGALGDKSVSECHKCSNCSPVHSGIGKSTFDVRLISEVKEYLKFHDKEPFHLKNDVPNGAFEKYKYLESNMLQCNQIRLASYAMDGGWGNVVRNGEKDRHTICDEEFIDYVCDLVLNLGVRCVICVPCTSSTQSEMLRKFCRNLAKKLNVHFRQPVGLSLDRIMKPRKDQKNDFFRCRNLDGAYVIDEKQLPEDLDGGVLLVDRFTCSGWTLRVAAALLTNAGCSAVHPLALSKMTIPD